MALGSDQVGIGLVGGGRGGSALLDLLLDWPVAKVAVVVDPRPEAPALGKARALGIPTAAHHLEVFAYAVDLVLEVTGHPAVLDDLLHARPPGVEVIGAGGLRFFWDLLQDNVKATRQMRAQLDMAVALGSTLDLTQQVALVTRKLARACGVDRCTIFLWDDATALVTPFMSQFATGEQNEQMWNAFNRLGRLTLKSVPFLYEVMERQSPIEIYDPATNPLMPRGWADLFETKSLLVVPIFRRKGRVGGACTLDYCREPHRFEPDQAELAIALAGQVSLALENARLYQRAEERAQKLTALSTLTSLITSATDTQQVFHAVARAATTLLGAKLTRVWVADPGAQVLRTQADFGVELNLVQAVSNVAVMPYGAGLGGRVFEARTPEYVVDVQQDSRWLDQRLAKEVGLHAFAGLPLVTGDRVVGVLSILFGDRRQFTPEEKELMGLLADQAAIAINNTRLYEETERRRRAAESLAKVGHVLAQSLHLPTVGLQIVDSLRVLLDTQTAALFQLEPESGNLVSVGFSGEVGSAFRPPLIFPRGTGVVGLAVVERRLVVTPDLLTDRRITLTPELRARIEQETFRSALAVPLIGKDGVIGALAVGDQPGRVFDADAMQLAQGFADNATIALENAGLYAEATRRRREAEELARVARTLTESLDVSAVGERIVQSVLPLFGVQSSVLRLLRPDGSLVAIASSGAHRDYFEPGHVLPSGAGGVTGRAVAEGTPVWSRDALSDPNIVFTDEMRRRVAVSGNRAALAVPLRVKGEITGVLTIADRAVRAFSEAEVALLQTFADQAAIALENARLYAELRAALEQVEASQQRIVQTERLRALGEMAAGVAHDFNNLLAVILGRAELLLARAREPELARGLEAVRTAALDGAQTVRRIQEFTRTRRARLFGRVDLWELLPEVVELTRPRWKDEAQSRGVSYEVRVEGGPVPPVAGISEELREAFTNLLINALEAMPAGGRFIFRVMSEADNVVVTAEDTGCGMSEETRLRVFEPFFTTKGPRGTGLGLAVVWGIITRHGGTIDVESTLGVGSTFTIRLPMGRKIPSEEKPTSLPQPGRGGRVLVIDDEPEVRAVVRDLLAEQGYAVLEAADGAEGLARCEAEPVDLVLSDLSMPGMSGWEVAEACRERFPRVPVAFITGWGDQLDPDQLERHRVRFVLAKPFVASDVLRQVALALTTARAG